MTHTLSKLLQDAKGEPVLVSGELVHGIYKRLIKGGSSFTVKRVRCSNDIPQGLRIKCDKGQIEINGQLVKDAILWAETSPSEVNVKFVFKSESTVKFWNVWRSNEVLNAWVGNAGLHVKDEIDKVTLECSNGVGEISFSDLVVEIEFL